MKKFQRLPPEKRKEEISLAAIELFNEKGFSKTTMENIVERVSLSKGGVYRLYPSTTAILKDLIISGMHLRNAFYEQCVSERIKENKKLDIDFIVSMVADSLLMYPQISSVYVEFLLEKRRNEELGKLFDEITRATVEETSELIKRYGADDILLCNPDILIRLSELMNSAVLSMHILDLKDKDDICRAITYVLKNEN